MTFYSTNNEEKLVAAKRFIRTLKRKIYKYTAAILEHVYNDNKSSLSKLFLNLMHICFLLLDISQINLNLRLVVSTETQST